MAPRGAVARAEGPIPELTIASDRFDEDRGGREGYLADLARHVACAGDGVRRVRVRPGESVSGLARPVLAAIPVRGATHYQLHSGLYRDAFEAERESLPSALRRSLFRPALRFNRFRSTLLAAEERLLRGDGESRLMVFSETLRRRVVSEFGAAGARVVMDRPGVDRDLFRPPDRPADSGAPPRLLFVGHNFELKGLRTLFGALAIAREAGEAALTVVGGGPIARFRRLAARRGLAARVEFTGAIERARLAELYRRHDALVHPSFYDPYPLVVVEALASGLPVVTTRRTGASEIVPPDGGIVLEDPADAAGLAAALVRLSDPAARRALGDGAARAGAGLDARSHFARMRRWLGLDPALGTA